MNHSRRSIWRCFLTSLYAVTLIVVVPASKIAVADVVDRSEIGFDQKIGHQIPLDLVFQNSAGEDVLLKDYFGKKPVIVMPVFYRCPMLCGLELNGFVRGLKGLEFSTNLQL